MAMQDLDRDTGPAISLSTSDESGNDPSFDDLGDDEIKVIELALRSWRRNVARDGFKIYPINVGLQRLVDFDRRSKGQDPVYIKEISEVDPDVARNLYLSGVDSLIADLAVSPDSARLYKSSSIVQFVHDRGELDGLEGPFLTSMAMLQAQGQTNRMELGLTLLRQAKQLTSLGGNAPAMFFYDPATQVLSPLSLPAFRRAFGTERGSPRIGGGRNIGEVASAAREGDPVNKSDLADCIDRGKAIGGAAGRYAGGWAGKRYGAEAGAAIGSVGGPGGAVLGAAIGIKYGEKAGAVAGAYVGAKIGEAIGKGVCAPTPPPPPPPPPPSPPPPPPPRPDADPKEKDKPGKPLETGPAIKQAGGKGDDGPKEPNEQVASQIPDYDGPTMSDTGRPNRPPPRDTSDPTDNDTFGVIRAWSETSPSGRVLDEVVRAIGEGRFDMRGSPRVVDLDGGVKAVAWRGLDPMGDLPIELQIRARASIERDPVRPEAYLPGRGGLRTNRYSQSISTSALGALVPSLSNPEEALRLIGEGMARFFARGG